MKALDRRLAVLAPAFIPTCRQCGGALQCRHWDPRPLQRLRAEELQLLAVCRGGWQRREHGAARKNPGGGGAHVSESEDRQMKSLLRRVVKLEQHAETLPIDLPPLPPSGASEEELERAAQEAWQQLVAHPHQPGRFLHLIAIAQRFGLTSKIGQELFSDGAAQEAAASADTAPPANTGTVAPPPTHAPPAQASRPPRRPPGERDWTDW